MRTCHRLAALGGLLAAPALPAFAQTAEPAAAPQRIEITGSNIKRIEGETALPVQVITRDDIRKTGATSVEQLLMTVSAATSANNFVAAASSGANTAALSAASLRGLGSTRTLVLVNGRRVTAYGTTTDSSSVDLNSLPLAAIDRVEVLKDGASAIYGSDAIGGVINFILRKDFRGAETTLGYGAARGNSGAVKKWNGLWGIGDLGEDGYNFMLLGTWQKEEGLFGRDRDFASRGYNEGAQNDTTSFNAFPANFITLPDGAFAGNPAYPDCAPSTVTFSRPGFCSFDPSPSVALFPQTESFGLFASGRIRLGAEVEGYAEASYARNAKRTVIQPVPISSIFALPPNHPLFNVEPYNGFSTVHLSPSSPYYPTDYVRGLVGTAAPLPVLDIYYRSVLTGNRDLTDISETPRFTAGVTGAAGGWDFDAALLYSANRIRQKVNGGYPALTKLLPLLNSGQVNFFGPNTDEVQALADDAQFRGTAYETRSRLVSLSGKASRELLKLPGGPLSVAFGAEFRKESYQLDPNPTIQTGDISGYGGNLLPVDRSRNVSAAYVELDAQILKTLEANVAVRHDRYQNTGNATTPKASLRWQPLPQLLLRASAGRGFRAPSLTDLYAPVLIGVTPQGFSDPLRCPTTGLGSDCATQFTALVGGNPDLTPEKATTQTLGIVLEPMPGVSLALDAFRIKLSETIIYGIDPNVILGDLDRFGFLVGRGPVQPQYPNLPGPITSINQTNLNLGETRVSGVDVDAKLRLPAGEWGRFAFSVNGTYFSKYETQNLDGSFTPQIDTAQTLGGLIPRWRAYHTLDWKRGPWNLTLGYSYQGNYDDLPGNQNAAATRTVGAYETWDLQTAYEGFRNTTLVVGVKNLLDRDPPYSNQGGSSFFQGGYDPSYVDPRGRFGYVSLTWRFQ